MSGRRRPASLILLYFSSEIDRVRCVPERLSLVRNCALRHTSFAGQRVIDQANRTVGSNPTLSASCTIVCAKLRSSSILRVRTVLGPWQRRRASAARDAKNRGRRRDCDHGRLDRARACGRRQAAVRHPSGGRSPSFAPSSRGRHRGSVSSRQHLNSTGAVSVRQSVIANVER